MTGLFIGVIVALIVTVAARTSRVQTIQPGMPASASPKQKPEQRKDCDLS